MDSERRSESSSATRSEAEVPLDVLPLHSTNLLTVLDEDGVIQYESPSVERIYGYDQDDLVGDSVAEYFHPEDRESVVAAFQAVVNSQEEAIESVEYRHLRADGTYLWVESIASANPTPDGQYVVNTRDISEQKEREQHLQTTNEQLEEFASVVSHDLRNPLNVAQARLELARAESESPHLDDVATAHDRMGTLIEELLTLSRAGKQVSKTEQVALADLVETCWQTVSTADATLVTDTDQRLRADRGRLQQLLENLVRNAVEHGGADVTVTVGECASRFYVEDDGPGIPASERTHVFTAGNSACGGTGLGLNIVEKIVEAHDWRIRVTDGTRGGARFEITDVGLAQ
ncbi:sensor histidine kinase [Salinibaculum rarum]|uniref:sensor histidine kinase n=1 Tax=Salinibaculum rarum TaxID=3058903 RepID=UPI00265E9CB1|nr:PAS domain-containing sensor histidine kinase [Salinibaculum sp. KK48]